MIKVGEHITLDFLGVKKDYSPDFYEKVIIDTEDNPAKNQMKTYLKCLDNSEIEYNYSNLIHSHQILLDSE